MIRGSVYSDEQELLGSLIEIHCPNGIQLDPMYFKGNFYKEVKPPPLIFDIKPLLLNVKQADARALPINSETIKSMILDPPFMFGIHGKTTKYYSSRTHGIFRDFGELENLYKGILKEAFRLLIKRGILLFKCQDYTDSKTTMTHCFVYNWAVELGFYVKDIAILHKPKNKIYNPNLKQRHLRKFHSYFWVLSKP